MVWDVEVLVQALVHPVVVAAVVVIKVVVAVDSSP